MRKVFMRTLSKLFGFWQMVYFLIYLTLLEEIRGAHLFSPSIHDSSVFASSAIPGSKPEYVIDEDFHFPSPTCFRTDENLPDSQGFHWLLIDFETTLEKIREIRLVTEKNAWDNGNAEGIEAYVINSLESSKEEINGTALSHRKQTLSWESPSFQYCASNEQIEQRGQTVTVRCEQTLDGRWLAIRQRKSLSICLVNIYVEHAFEECFASLQNTSELASGSVFRHIRHMPRDSCRAMCTYAPECEAVVFRGRHRRDSGICELVHSFQRNSNDPRSDHLCQDDHLSCTIDINHCHKGILKSLQRIAEPESTIPSNEQRDSVIHEWIIRDDKPLTGTAENETEYLLSVYFQGRLQCSEWNCGLLYIYAVDPYGMEVLCTFINTENVVVLEKTSLFCDYKTPPKNTQRIHLKWKPVQMDDYSGNPILDILIYRANLRVSTERPNAPLHLPELKTTERPQNAISSTGVRMPTTQPIEDSNVVESKIEEFTTEPTNEIYLNQPFTDPAEQATRSASTTGSQTTPYTKQKDSVSPEPSLNYPVNDEQQPKSAINSHPPESVRKSPLSSVRRTNIEGRRRAVRVEMGNAASSASTSMLFLSLYSIFIWLSVS